MLIKVGYFVDWIDTCAISSTCLQIYLRIQGWGVIMLERSQWEYATSESLCWSFISLEYSTWGVIYSEKSSYDLRRINWPPNYTQVAICSNYLRTYFATIMSTTSDIPSQGSIRGWCFQTQSKVFRANGLNPWPLDNETQSLLIGHWSLRIIFSASR